MDFVDRRAERERLNESLRLNGGFVVVWGRRRIGKTRLLLDWAMENDGIYVVAATGKQLHRALFVPVKGTMHRDAASGIDIIDAEDILNCLV